MTGFADRVVGDGARHDVVSGLLPQRGGFEGFLLDLTPTCARGSPDTARKPRLTP